jgi:hypothetical protein
VPDPSFATGDEQADGSAALPRCFICKLSDWKRAESEAARVASTPNPTSATGGSDDSNGWSPTDSSQLFYKCTMNWRGSAALCGCVVDQLAQQEIPVADIAGLSADDPSVSAAATACGAEPGDQ